MKTILLVLLFSAPVSAQGWYQYSYDANGNYAYQWGYMPQYQNEWYYRPRPVLYYRFGSEYGSGLIIPSYPYGLLPAQNCYGGRRW